MQEEEYIKDIEKADGPDLVGIVWTIVLDNTITKEQRERLIDKCVERYNVIM